MEESPKHGLRKDSWKQLTRVSIPAISGDKQFGGQHRQNNLHSEDQFLPDVIVINRKKAGKKEELGNGSLNMKVQQKMTSAMLANNNRWVFEQKKGGMF